MGCGGSTAKGAVEPQVVMAIIPQPLLQSTDTTANSASPPQPSPSASAADSNNNNINGVGGGVKSPSPSAPVPPALSSSFNSLPDDEISQQRKGDADPQSTNSELPSLDAPLRNNRLAPIKNRPMLATSPPARAVSCDNDTCHIATVTCDDCGENFCDECDAWLHNRPKTKAHVRRPVGSASPNAPQRKLENDDSTKFGARRFERQGSKLKRSGSKLTKAGESGSPQVSAAAAPSPAAKGRAVQNGLQMKAPAAAAAPVMNRETTGRNVLNDVPIEKLRSMSAQQLNVIWNQYDIDGNGVLDRKELKLLANDCIERMLKMMEDEFRKQNPKLSDGDIRKAVEKERLFILPGKKKEDSHKEMVKMLVRKLDINGDGNVTKTELQMQWNAFSKDIFQMRTDGALDCSIM